MTRNLKGSLLIASMLVVPWTTSSEACHRRRLLPAHPELLPIGVHLREPHGLLRAGRGGYTTTDGGYYGGGYTGGTAGYPSGYGQPGPGTTSAGPATTRAASVGRRPG